MSGDERDQVETDFYRGRDRYISKIKIFIHHGEGKEGRKGREREGEGGRERGREKELKG